MLNRCFVELPPDPVDASPMRSSELQNGLPAPDMLPPKSLYDSSFARFAILIFPTMGAAIPLLTPSPPVLYEHSLTAYLTLFLRSICSRF
jgi:hypothetical protein